MDESPAVAARNTIVGRVSVEWRTKASAASNVAKNSTPMAEPRICHSPTFLKVWRYRNASSAYLSMVVWTKRAVTKRAGERELNCRAVHDTINSSLATSKSLFSVNWRMSAPRATRPDDF